MDPALQAMDFDTLCDELNDAADTLSKIANMMHRRDIDPTLANYIRELNDTEVPSIAHAKDLLTELFKRVQAVH
jgi:uncharacterized protein Yka (UPF0111/DUF47 family)